MKNGGHALQTQKRMDRLARLAELVEAGHDVDEIAEILGVRRHYVSGNAFKLGIPLRSPPGRIIDVNRIVGQTVEGGRALTAGLDMVASRSHLLDWELTEEWIVSLQETVGELRRLIKQLQQHGGHHAQTGKQRDGGKVRQAGVARQSRPKAGAAGTDAGSGAGTAGAPPVLGE